VDYAGEVIEFQYAGKTFVMRTMYGPLCCAGHPLAGRYLNSISTVETAWSFQVGDRLIQGLDSRGTSADGTHWRWVGPLLGEFAEYEGANAEAAKYFDSILDTLCIARRF